MSIYLFTDFGAADIYVGQIKAALARHAPGIGVIDLLHEAPAFDARAGAHLLAALVAQLDANSVSMAVVDPGVGSARHAVVVYADQRWLLGPDNGLLSVVAARARQCAYWRITWQPAVLSASFHGRDLFAPMAAEIARGNFPADRAVSANGLTVDWGATDLGQIVYIDHYGNAFTGLRAGELPQHARVVVHGRPLGQARVFSDVAPGATFWYENSLGLVEIAGNGCSAALKLGLAIGQPVGIAA